MLTCFCSGGVFMGAGAAGVGGGGGEVCAVGALGGLRVGHFDVEFWVGGAVVVGWDLVWCGIRGRFRGC